MGPICCFIDCYFSYQSHPLVCIIHFEIKFYTHFSIWKKVKSRPFYFHLTVVRILDHDSLVVHILSNARIYTLLFSCAYLKDDKACSFRVFKWVHIPLILYKYISYIVPILFFTKFLYYIICLDTSDNFSVLPSWKFFIFSSTLVLTSSIDVVFILSITKYQKTVVVWRPALP